MGKERSLPNAPEYPQLAEIADPERLARTTQRHMGPRFESGELAIERCKVKRIYYKPGPEGSCRIHFRARIRDEGREREQTFFAQLWPRDAVADHFDRALRRERVEPEYGQSVALVPDWDMILWAYPNDPRLIGLPHLSDTDGVLREMQAEPLRFGLPAGRRAVRIEAQRTKYVPGQRCGSLFRVGLDSGNGACTERVVYGKAYRGRLGLRAYRVARQVWESEPRRRGALRLPEPYSYDEARNILWQEALPGRPLAKTAAGASLPEVASRAGAGLAAFHGAELELPLGRTVAAQIADQQRAASSLDHTFPDRSPRIQALHQRLLAAREALGPELETPVHGSFKFSHIFLSDDRISFIDFDGATLGDPTYDVGRFVAHVEEMRASLKLPAEIADRTVERFVEGYNDAARTALPEARIRWFASSLVLSSQVYKAVKRFDPGLIEKLVDRAETLCP